MSITKEEAEKLAAEIEPLLPEAIKQLIALHEFCRFFIIYYAAQPCNQADLRPAQAEEPQTPEGAQAAYR